MDPIAAFGGICKAGESAAQKPAAAKSALAIHAGKDVYRGCETRKPNPGSDSMFDTMTMTKAVAGVCAAMLVFLFAKWGAEILYGEGGHGDGAHAAASYVIEIEDDSEGTADSSGESVDIETLLASADVERGRKVFSKCKACHKLEDGENGTGPHLFAVVDRPVAEVQGFAYSTAMAALGGNWSLDRLDGFMERPSKYLPGTKMSFAGLKKEKDRVNLIAYLKTIGP